LALHYYCLSCGPKQELQNDQQHKQARHSHLHQPYQVPKDLIQEVCTMFTKEKVRTHIYIKKKRAEKCSGYREENCSQHQALAPSLHNKTFTKKVKH
jgi:hypothetical protein